MPFALAMRDGWFFLKEQLDLIPILGEYFLESVPWDLGLENPSYSSDGGFCCIEVGLSHVKEW